MTNERCGLSAICLKSWIVSSVIILINNKCRFHHGVHPLGYWHISSPIKLIFPITIPNEVSLFHTFLTVHFNVVKNINRVLPQSYIGRPVWKWRWTVVEGSSVGLIFACLGWGDVYRSMTFAQLGLVVVIEGFEGGSWCYDLRGHMMISQRVSCTVVRRYLQ